ncbi:putative conserved protein YndB, AHSA1/START domain [Streptoalloteichus tenebrarius]|uniref:Conserved protein YndB, AHSA1/START domain n=1 Tax=Streptoalloteichus tenebrarius (strain ATCC 17920 / DSM 40477 / JCM 4838 / CBS 697.72 / NBRC 16177 / NCIMB 11028 / NRRL B-12390 / A12253. 1 / ISP 5477) TaxID=1933 RepID=A0ABT1HQ53_STRSD|nr:SRPBCC domain-containing protein [Streptoalloteichus tenebrarius]MCP2257633.1 putative conserved protein YndB, AHSA1/START domain [Streptoalloteichus tenebrarius]BFE98592.1 SRPBCC domain-containing protein [Streptoalloteichus tenebrarius]
MSRVVGRTRDAGFQIGVSRTLPHARERVWAFLTSPEGLALWLGEGARLEGVGAEYRTEDGTVGEVRGLREHDRVRVTWRPADWDHETTVQVAVRGDDRTMLRFHQERLADAEERERQRAHWQRVMDQVAAALDPLDARG